VTCEICDYYYSSDWSSSRRAHVIAHDEWFRGVRLRRRQDFEDVGQIQDFQALLVRPSSSLFARHRAERVSRRSIREPIDEGGYDTPPYYAEGPDSPTELSAHAVVLGRETHAVGIVVLERRPIIELYRWTTRPHFELAAELPPTVRWAIVHTWLLPELRGRGVASDLVRAAVQGVNETPDTVGWLSPYTGAGWRLIERLTTAGFHRAICKLPPIENVPPPFQKAEPSQANLGLAI
jgi:hypothetical protein